jgi:hypothetical protein
MGFIDDEHLNTFPVNDFQQRTPFPWMEFSQFLTPAGFNALHRSFPSLEIFEKHSNLARPYDQRPHNRYYLAYERSTYSNHGRGIVGRKDLSHEWASFINELETNVSYHKLIQSLFEVSSFKIRFAWHIGVTNSEVSPHVDTTKKVGTQLLYFNTDQDWKPDWGGSTLVLGGKRSESMSPDFADFASAIPIETIGNRSFVFKNSPNAWHGMKTLKCPEGSYRRIFNIIFEVPDKTPNRTLMSRGKSLASRTLNKFRAGT